GLRVVSKPGEDCKNALPFVRMFKESEGLAQDPIAQRGKSGNRGCGEPLEDFGFAGLAEKAQRIVLGGNGDCRRDAVSAKLAVIDLRPHNLIPGTAPRAAMLFKIRDPRPHII